MQNLVNAYLADQENKYVLAFKTKQKNELGLIKKGIFSPKKQLPDIIAFIENNPSLFANCENLANFYDKLKSKIILYNNKHKKNIPISIPLHFLNTCEVLFFRCPVLLSHILFFTEELPGIFSLINKQFYESVNHQCTYRLVYKKFENSTGFLGNLIERQKTRIKSFNTAKEEHCKDLLKAVTEEIYYYLKNLENSKEIKEKTRGLTLVERFNERCIWIENKTLLIFFKCIQVNLKIEEIEDIEGVRNYLKNDIKTKPITKISFTKKNLLVIPKEICYFEKVREIDFHGNLLKYIPEEIENLNCLETLDISDNYIEEIPKKLANLKNLKKLIIYSEPPPHCPDEIKQKENLGIISNIERVISIAANGI